MDRERLHVAVRVRPLHPVTELGHENTITVRENFISVKSDLHHDMKTKYDIIMHHNDQADVYNKVVQPIVPFFINGFNCTIFTYG